MRKRSRHSKPPNPPQETESSPKEETVEDFLKGIALRIKERQAKREHRSSVEQPPASGESDINKSNEEDEAGSSDSEYEDLEEEIRDSENEDNTAPQIGDIEEEARGDAYKDKSPVTKEKKRSMVANIVRYYGLIFQGSNDFISEKELSTGKSTQR